jgi:hypothetical protein
MTTPVHTPALDLWRKELRKGVGGQRADRVASWWLDPLWQAACWERSAQDANRAGFPHAAARDLAHAATLIVAGAQKRTAAA